MSPSQREDSAADAEAPVTKGAAVKTPKNKGKKVNKGNSGDTLETPPAKRQKTAKGAQPKTPTKPAGAAATETPETVSSFAPGSASSAPTTTPSKKRKDRAEKAASDVDSDDGSSSEQDGADRNSSDVLGISAKNKMHKPPVDRSIKPRHDSLIDGQKRTKFRAVVPPEHAHDKSYQRAMCHSCAGDLSRFPAAVCWQRPNSYKCGDCFRKGKDCDPIDKELKKEFLELTEAAQRYVEGKGSKYDLNEELDESQKTYNHAYAKLNIVNRKTEKKMEKAGMRHLVEETLGFRRDFGQARRAVLHQGDTNNEHLAKMVDSFQKVAKGQEILGKVIGQAVVSTVASRKQQADFNERLLGVLEGIHANQKELIQVSKHSNFVLRDTIDLLTHTNNAVYVGLRHFGVTEENSRGTPSSPKGGAETASEAPAETEAEATQE